MWITEHEADVESDLSAFHRIDDPMTIDAPRYFRLALRLAAYMGVVCALAHREAERDGSMASAPRGAAQAPSRVADTVALAMLAADGDIEYERTS